MALLSSYANLILIFIFLYFVVIWLEHRDSRNLCTMVDITLAATFHLVLLQPFTYHTSVHFKLMYGSTSSGQASSLYNKSIYFWGLDDKNMFGARIAMLGFPFILIPLLRDLRISWLRICFLFVLAYLSLSRTPIVALMI